MNKALAIAISTFKGYLRSKIIYGIVGILLLYILGLALMIVQTRALEGASNQNMYFVTFSSGFFQALAVLTAIISSAFLVAREVKDRTSLFILTKPLTSLDFVLGKWLGAVLLLIFITFLFAVPFHVIGLVFFNDLYFYQDLFFLSSVIGLAMLSAFVLALSLNVSPVPAIVFPLLFNTSWIGGLIGILEKASPDGKAWPIAKEAGLAVLYVVYYILPSFDNIVLNPAEIVWGKVFLLNYLFSLAYAADMTLIYLLAGAYFFRRKRRRLVGSAT